jgi:hypothetical protein
MLLYVAAFLFAVVSWLRWPDELARAAFAIVTVAFVVTTVGIATRMWLENRPPVTNLYSSALCVCDVRKAKIPMYRTIARYAKTTAAAIIDQPRGLSPRSLQDATARRM